MSWRQDRDEAEGLLVLSILIFFTLELSVFLIGKPLVYIQARRLNCSQFILPFSPIGCCM